MALDEEGKYFIDRNGDAFEPILEFLRTKQLLNFGISKERRRKEAEYFGLDQLLQMLEEPKVRPEPKKEKKTVIFVNSEHLMFDHRTLV